MTTATSSKSMKSSNILATTVMAAVMMLVMAVPAEAKTPKVSEILDNNGFTTLLFALDTTGLTSVVDENRVVLFAPTDDVFEATAELLGCSSVLELATNLLNTTVGDTNALAIVLTYHAYLGRLKNDYEVLSAGELPMANGDTVTTGVDRNGQSVKGIVNETASTITTAAFKAKRGSSVYGIDQILLPIDPSGICAS